MLKGEPDPISNKPIKFLLLSGYSMLLWNLKDHLNYHKINNNTFPYLFNMAFSSILRSPSCHNISESKLYEGCKNETSLGTVLRKGVGAIKNSLHSNFQINLKFYYATCSKLLVCIAHIHLIICDQTYLLPVLQMGFI